MDTSGNTPSTNKQTPSPSAQLRGEFNGGTLIVGLDLEKSASNAAKPFHALLRVVGGEIIRHQHDEISASAETKLERLKSALRGKEWNAPDKELKATVAGVLSTELSKVINETRNAFAQVKNPAEVALNIKTGAALEAQQQGLNDQQTKQYINDRIQFVELVKDIAKRFPQSMREGQFIVDIKPNDVDRILGHLAPTANLPHSKTTVASVNTPPKSR